MELWLRVLGSAALMGVCTAISYGYTIVLRRLRERRIRDRETQAERIQSETELKECQHVWKFEDSVMYPKNRLSYIYKCCLCGRMEIRKSNAEDSIELPAGKIYELSDDGMGRAFALHITGANATVKGNGNTVIQNSKVKIK